MLMLMSGRTSYPNRSHPALKALRQKRGLSQDELGFQSGVSQARLSRAERGYLWLTADECERVARALAVEASALDGHTTVSRMCPRAPGSEGLQ
jgi:transcriptional regulator with XRE-family HTH domain